MKYLVIGGSKSGKSKVGEKIALTLNKNKVIYIATMKPFDIEDEIRIKNHIKSRENLNFITVEQDKNLINIIDEIKEEDTILIDSLTSLLTNEMFDGNIIHKNPYKKIIKELEILMDKVQNTVIVSDYIFNDSISYDKVTENYKKQLALMNKHLSSMCENVIECSYGNIKFHKAKDGWRKL